ncbi:hypothetical protein [Sphingobium ummariense]|uniref:Cell envelope biogenesis protein TolA n=1 Tax=Sphingobium ummariense RL-3 TaxID=1346791 RepID=T0J7C9_9SPHN|nr:hypothetical protein [Sphingobium ummariense]EQB32732.1 hypothetical protein M529_07800 [Sphingobium ummariense RL-3]
MARTLKVFRTAIGFHDAYVAAPSQKAALEVWGADIDLFARGVAEVVLDETLAAEPLAHPGKVIKRPRGTMAEHLAALPKTKPVSRDKAGRVGKAKPTPRPDRSALEAAEETLTQARKAQEKKRSELAAREAALRRERQAMDKRHAAEIQRLERRRDDAKRRYDRAMDAWRETA